MFCSFQLDCSKFQSNYLEASKSFALKRAFLSGLGKVEMLTARHGGRLDSASLSWLESFIRFQLLGILEILKKICITLRKPKPQEHLLFYFYIYLLPELCMGGVFVPLGVTLSLCWFSSTLWVSLVSEDVPLLYETPEFNLFMIICNKSKFIFTRFNLFFTFLYYFIKGIETWLRCSGMESPTITCSQCKRKNNWINYFQLCCNIQ